MLGNVLIILSLLAASRSIVRYCKARRISDGLFAFFWLSLAASTLLDSRLMTLIPLCFLVAGAIAKGKESRIGRSGEKFLPPAEETKPFQLSDPPSPSPIGRPGNSSEAVTEAPNEDEDESLIPRIPEFAEDWVIFGKIKNRNFDYSPGSLEEVDALISEEWNEEAPIFPSVTILQAGSYVGEVIRREQGGEWVETEERGVHLTNIGGRDFKAFPFNKARKRILDGEGDSVAFFYRALKQTIEKELEEDEKS